jgi:hypothetical protein
MITIQGPQLSHVTYVAANLRLTDQYEFEATLKNAPLQPSLVELVANSIPYAYVALEDGQPIFMYGVLTRSIQPHYGLAWGFGTDRAKRAIPAVGRHIKETLVPLLLRAGLTRVEVRVVQDAKSSARWLTKYMGAQFETNLVDQGTGGETFRQYAWTRTMHNRTQNVLSFPASAGSGHVQ